MFKPPKAWVLVRGRNQQMFPPDTDVDLADPTNVVAPAEEEEGDKADPV